MFRTYNEVPKKSKQQQLEDAVAEAVAGVLNDPRFAVTALGTENRKRIVANVEKQVNDKIMGSKEKAVDRILANVKRDLMQAGEFEFEREDSGKVTFKFSGKVEDYGF